MKVFEYKNIILNVIFKQRFVVYHAFARFYNFGDNALSYGMKNIFQRFFKREVCFVNQDVHTTIFDSEKIREINKVADLFLIGGGGLIHVLDKFWMFNMDIKDIKSVKIPMIFYGLGFNHFEDDVIDEKVIKNIIKLQEKAIGFSVRNDGSRERLAEYGLNFDEVPDPGFFVNGQYPRPNIDGEYVMVQLAYDAPKERNIETESFVDNMINVCRNLISKGYAVVLAPHCGPDMNISAQIVNQISNKKCFMWDWWDIMREDNVVRGLGYYKHAKFVLAMRGHAQICPIGMNVPVISIINHPKHIGLLKKINQEKLSVSVSDRNFVEKINELINYVEQNYENIKQEYTKLMKVLTEQTNSYISKLRILYDSICDVQQ